MRHIFVETMAKPAFNDEQQEILHAAAKRVWKQKFQAENKTQEEFALSLGLSQQSVSALLKGTYRPGLVPARAIANLDGKTLEQLVGDFGHVQVTVVNDKAPDSREPVALLGPSPITGHAPGAFKNLDVCLQFYAATKHWSAWTVAAARAGFFGNSDFAPPEWAGRLDKLEVALERARKAG